MQWFKSCSERATPGRRQAERLALAAPIVAPGPVATLAEPEARRSWLRSWFGWRAAG